MSSIDEQSDAMSADVMAATIAGLQAERAAMAAKVASLEESLTDLAHENALLKRRLFGSKTERIVTSELQLALGDLLATEAKLQADLDASIKRAERALRKIVVGGNYAESRIMQSGPFACRHQWPSGTPHNQRR